MTAADKAFHAMVHSTVRTRSQHAAVTATPPALVRAFDALVAAEARINAGRRRQGGSGLEAITEEKDTLKRALITAVHPLAGILQAYAAEQNDTELLRATDRSYYDLYELPDRDSANRCGDLLAQLTPARRPHLESDYGLTPAAEATAQELLTEFANRIGARREEIGALKSAAQEIATAIADARQILKNRLDPLIRQYNVPPTDPSTQAQKAFHEAYHSARIIVDAPSKKKKPTPPQ